MKINNVNSTSFKGTYLLKGSEEVLDEISWYLGRKQNDPASDFYFLSIRNGLKKASLSLKSGERADLFLTQKERKIIEPSLYEIVRDSTIESLNDFAICLNDKFKILAEKNEELSQRLRLGKPLLNVNPDILEKYLGFINIPSVSMSKAEAALRGIEKNSFDIISGRCN